MLWKTTVHLSQLEFYFYLSLDGNVIISDLLSSDAVIPVLRLLLQLYVIIHWKGVTKASDKKEPLACIHEDVKQLFIKLLELKSTSHELRGKARVQLAH